MKRSNVTWLAVLTVGATVVFGCTADLREFNTCRAASMALCERVKECSSAFFDKTYTDLEDCTKKVEQGTTFSSNVASRIGIDVCPSDKSTCFDKIKNASCGQYLDAKECGSIVQGAALPDGNGNLPAGATVPTTKSADSDAGSSSSSTSSSSADRISSLTSGVPDVFEVFDGDLVACSSSSGCRSSSGDSYGSSDTGLSSYAIDADRNVWGLRNSAIVRITPSGSLSTTSLPGLTWKGVLSLTTARSSATASSFVLAVRSQDSAIFAIASDTMSPTYVASFSSSDTIMAAAPVGTDFAVAAGQSVYRCTPQGKSGGGSCQSTGIDASDSFIRPAEGTDAGDVFVGIDTYGSPYRVNSSFSQSTASSSSCSYVAQRSGSLACVTSYGSLIFKGSTVSAASNVAKVAIDDSYLYWVTTSGDYYRLAR